MNPSRFVCPLCGRVLQGQSNKPGQRHYRRKGVEVCAYVR